MARRRLLMKKKRKLLQCRRQLTAPSYCKQRDGIVKKADELSVKCGVDVGLILFSPKGKLTTFSSSGRVEDVFLRYMERSNGIENHENLYQSLKQVRQEGEMVDKLARIEALEQKLEELNQVQSKKQEQLKCYNCDVEKINSINEATVHEQFLTNAIQNIQRLKQQQMLISQMKARNSESVEAVDLKARESTVENHWEGKGYCSSAGPHLSLDFLAKQKSWNLSINSLEL
ncbi:Agamous-like MADS-box protein AGL104 [Linum perenne]